MLDWIKSTFFLSIAYVTLTAISIGAMLLTVGAFLMPLVPFMLLYLIFS